MNKKVFSIAICSVFVLFYAEFLMAEVKCGYSIYPLIETPHPYPTGGPHAPVVWSKTISKSGATWLRVHFLVFELHDEDYVDLIDMDGNLRERIKGIDVRSDKTSRFKVIENPDGTVNFWGPTIEGNLIRIELHSVSIKSAGWGFIIDEIGIGFFPIEEELGILAICGEDDKEDIACYKGTLKYTRAEAVGRMKYKKNSTWYYCTGSLVSCIGSNHFLTNEHCINSQSIVNTLEVRLHYQYRTCGGSTLESYTVINGDQYIKSHYTYDFCLITLKNEPQNKYGCLVPLSREPIQGESIYIPQHPGGRPKEIANCDVNNASIPSPVDGTPNTDFNYYCDTEGGSSGSPVIASSGSHRVLGLHHYAPCPNKAVKMSKIYPLIKADIDCDGASPAAPSNLDATPTAWSQIDLSWLDNSENEIGFKIERRTSTSEFSEIGNVWRNTITYYDKTCNVGTTYYYRVKAYNGNGESAFSNTDSATIPTGTPTAPTMLTARNESIPGKDYRVKLTWQDNSNNEQGFKIERMECGYGNWQEWDLAGPNETTYWDVDIPCDHEYCYRIRAYNVYGNSSYSNEAGTGVPCFDFWLKAKIISDKKIINSGESVTYIYQLENKGKVDLIDIELIDDKFGKIATKFTLKKGEARTFTKTVVLTETTTNSAEATAIYYHGNKIKSVKAHANVTVEVRK